MKLGEYWRVERANSDSQGIYNVRIIHGKGTGTLRTIVQSLLEKDPHVLRFQTALYDGGNWGATEVDLKTIDGRKK